MVRFPSDVTREWPSPLDTGCQRLGAQLYTAKVKDEAWTHDGHAHALSNGTDGLEVQRALDGVGENAYLSGREDVLLAQPPEVR